MKAGFHFESSLAVINPCFNAAMRTPDTDDSLVRLCRRGDEKALNGIIAVHVKSVYNLCRRITGNDADAEDATQETFLKFWRNLHNYKTGNNLRTWLLRIAHNASVDLLRKRRDILFSVLEENSSEFQFIDTIHDTGPAHGDIAMRNEDIANMNRLIEKLNPNQREILALHYQEHLTFREIGEIQGKPLYTVKSQHQRAIHSLRILMDAPNHQSRA
jgi:RNA polymerase sigma-70 factor, ECF subfamily